MHHATITPHGALTFGQPFRFGDHAEPGVPRARPGAPDRERCVRVCKRTMRDDCRPVTPLPVHLVRIHIRIREAVVPAVAAHTQLPRRVTRLDAPEEHRERQVNLFGHARHHRGVNRVQRRTRRVPDWDAPLGVVPIRRARFVVPSGLVVRQRIVV
ncbi:hypothetical protein [Chloroflexus sp.]|uniref:hypothetical protein n=1 Tax=Chloroflexus sp. TaxID=1904827 RepID=UPI003C78C424